MLKGRLKKSLKEKCPECGKKLQIRSISKIAIIEGVEEEYSEEYIACSDDHCEYEREFEKQRRRKF